MHTVSFAQFLLLFKASCIFSDVFLALRLPPSTCTLAGTVILWKILWLLWSLWLHSKPDGYFPFFIFFSPSNIWLLFLDSLLSKLSPLWLYMALVQISWKCFYSGCYHSMVGKLQKVAIILANLSSGCTNRMYTVNSWTFFSCVYHVKYINAFFLLTWRKKTNKPE